MFRYIPAVFLSIFFCCSSYAEVLRFEKFESDDLIVKYEETLKNAVSEISIAYPRVKDALERKLRLRLDIKPVIFLIHSDSAFSRMVKGNRLITAFAVPGDNSIYLDYSKMLNTPFDLELTLTHELSHLLLHKYVSPNHMPKWLDEGLSQWVSGGVADIINPDGKKMLKRAVLSGRYLSLDDISYRFPAEDDLLILAYEESKSLVEYIDDEYGSEKLLLVLKRLHEGDGINSAVLSTLSVSLSTLETEWHKYLKRRYTWYYYFADNLLWILFFGAAILSMVGYIKMRIRMKTFFDDEDEDEDE